jgi:hypothetical protein
MEINWEPFKPTIKDEDIPRYCDEGPFSHIWSFEVSYDGQSMWTDECEMCNAVAQSQYNDMAEYLCGEFTVRLEQEVEHYHHPEGTETDVIIRMKPA